MILLPPEDQQQLQSKEHQALHDDLRRGWHAKTVVAHENQLRMAKLMTELGPRHHPVLGQLTLVVDCRLYEEAKRLHGADCWRDPEFRRQLLAVGIGTGTVVVITLGHDIHARLTDQVFFACQIAEDVEEPIVVGSGRAERVVEIEQVE